MREELAKLKPPRGLEDLDAPFNPVATLPLIDVSAAPVAASGTTNAQVGTDDTIVPELNLLNENEADGDGDGDADADPEDVGTPTYFKFPKEEEALEEVVEILSDTENESTVWQEKEEEEEEESP